MPDDLKTDTPPASESTGSTKPPSPGSDKPRREIGPESEVRGGPEAPTQ